VLAGRIFSDEEWATVVSNALLRNVIASRENVFGDFRNVKTSVLGTKQ
jgi:hypothetical protein